MSPLIVVAATSSCMGYDTVISLGTTFIAWMTGQLNVWPSITSVPLGSPPLQFMATVTS